MELEKEIMNILAKVRQYELSMTQFKRNMQKCQITLKELGSVDEQKTYQPVGKCFIANEVVEIIISYEKDIDEYEKVKQYLITKSKEKETQLQEAMRAQKFELYNNNSYM